jgi:hypothetical protein
MLRILSVTLLLVTTNLMADPVETLPDHPQSEKLLCDSVERRSNELYSDASNADKRLRSLLWPNSLEVSTEVTELLNLIKKLDRAFESDINIDYKQLKPASEDVYERVRYKGLKKIMQCGRIEKVTLFKMRELVSGQLTKFNCTAKIFNYWRAAAAHLNRASMAGFPEDEMLNKAREFRIELLNSQCELVNQYKSDIEKLNRLLRES